MSTTAQIHRFRDTVATYLGDGATVYLTPKEAAQIATALGRAVKDIKVHPSFADSEFRTVTIPIKDQK